MKIYDPAEDGYSILPSDLGQSVVRVVLVSCVVIWTVVSASSQSAEALIGQPHFHFALLSWAVSIIAFIWTAVVLGRAARTSRLFLATRVASVFTDVGAASVYTAISGEAGIILYPVYLTICIGYGYRFGVRYLYLALVISAVFFSFAAQANPYIADNEILVWAYYLGIAVVPLYSASLLNRHREVLERIREVNLARSRFIANMSHELRTPLHAIISVSDLLSEEQSPKRDEVDGTYQKLRMIGDSAQHLLNLVNRVLDIASADAGGLGNIELRNIEFGKTILASLRICQPNAEQKGLDFYWFYDIRVPHKIHSSAEYLQEIVINTVGNAIKYTDAGYVYVGIRLDRSPKSQSCMIEIVDTGIGISAKLLPTIFEPFTLGDDSIARKYSGTGLGLTLTKQFVKNLNGNIDFKSIEGVGTQCSIAIPSNYSGGERIQPDSAEEIESCVLLSPREIGEDERESFAVAKWNCHVSNAMDSERTHFDSATAIFIDTDYRKHLDHVISSLNHLRPRRLIALYAPSESPESTERLEVNTIVRRGNVTHLVAAKHLTAAMFGTAKREVRHAPKGESVGARSVLVADDNSTNLKTARLTLESRGFKVKTVDSGDKALSELENSEYHIAIIDLHMPSMSGIEVTQIYQYLFGEPRTPIVILTADATVSAREDAIRAGAVALLTKPLRARELCDAVDKYARAASRTSMELSRPGNEIQLADPALLDESVIQEFLDIGVSDVELSEVLVSFLEDGRTLIETYVQAAQRNDAAQIRDVMHSLKGACATVGARKLMRRIEEIGERPLVKDCHDYRELSLELFDLLDESSRALMAKIE